MKLSEAILKGCKIAPVQLSTELGREGIIYSYDTIDLSQNAACACGAAALALGLKDYVYPELDKRYGKEVINQVLKENDLYTREQVAAMLAEAGL